VILPTEFNELIDLLGNDFVKNINLVSDRPNVYYGMNVSGNQREPIDQLDGFLLAKAIQQRNNIEFYPFLAGVYGIFNARSTKDAVKEQRRLLRRESEKKILLTNILNNLEINGKVLTTYDFWNDEYYWKIVENVSNEVKADLEDYGIGYITFSELPKELLGAFTNVLDNNFLAEMDAADIYSIAEVAEAVYLKEKYNVGIKIGPTTEEYYDKAIRKYNIGTIQFRVPKVWGPCFDTLDAVPYIGKSSEMSRIFFKESENRSMSFDKDNPSYIEAQTLLNVSKNLELPYKTIQDLIDLGRTL